MQANSVLRVARLRVEGFDLPLGVGIRPPRLSWQIQSSNRQVIQSAYQIRVGLSLDDLNHNVACWASSRIESYDSINCHYAGPLASRQRYYWTVRVWDQGGRCSDWSDPHWWEMGLLSAEDWQARWIEPLCLTETDGLRAAPLMRRPFHLSARVRHARLYVTCHGLYTAFLNGQRIGDRMFTPGWTSYSHRLQYQVYDVAAMLQPGDNVIGAMLGDGWYRGELGFEGVRNHYGGTLALLMQLEIVHADGRREYIVSDEHWRSSNGPILASDIYAGEIYDARREIPGWSTRDVDASQWQGVRTVPTPPHQLVTSPGPAVRRIQELSPTQFLHGPDGGLIVDFGQNMVGWVRLRVSGPAGHTLTIRHGEILDQSGALYTSNLGNARQEVRYTLKGQGPEWYEPHFTFQGFRYVAIDNFPGVPVAGDLTGIVVHSDLVTIGWLETSNDMINQLQSNIVWGIKGNFLDLPTDCPQRHERLGWTGDAQVIGPTAALNFDAGNFFAKWLADLAVEQHPDGSVPWVVPDVLHQFGGNRAAGAAGWGDAAIVIPWTLYQAYGDVSILERHYASMTRWVDFVTARAGNDYIWDDDFQFGDWLDFGSESRDRFGATPTNLVATAYYARSVDLLGRTATVLGNNSVALQRAEQLQLIKDTFCRQFIASDGKVGNGTQTGYVLALDFDLLPEALRSTSASHLAHQVRDTGHLTTGFLGTPRLLHALSRYGFVDEAYALLMRTQFPSWLYPITKGATTIWERWDGIKPDGSFQDPAMNSFNHYAYGAVGDWLFTEMAGIRTDPQAPGYRHSLIEPRIGGGLTRVAARLQTPHGLLHSCWELEDGSLKMRVNIPSNSSATIAFPTDDIASISSGGSSLATAPNIQQMQVQLGKVRVTVGSGEYDFEVRPNT